MKLRASRVRAVITIIIATAVGAAAFVLAVLNETGQKLEASVLQAADFEYTPSGPLMLVSNTSVAIGLVCVTGLALLRWGIGQAARVFIGTALALLLSQVLKLRVLERPPLWESDATNTFPSGHVTVYAAILGALIWAAPPAFRGFMSVFGTGLLALVAYQVVQHGWHRPSDVVGAIALTLVSFGLVAWIAPVNENSLGAKVHPRLAKKLLKIVVLLSLIAAVITGAIGFVTQQTGLWFFAGQAATLAGCAFCNREMISLTVVR